VSFSVTILGSGSAVPTSRRNPSGQLIECSNRYFLIDCGEGTQMQLRKFGVKFQKIDQIFISHLHGDHYFGLVGLLSTMHLMGRERKISIYGPVGLKSIIIGQLDRGGSKLSFQIHVEEIKPNTSTVLFEDEKCSVRCFPLSHSIPTSGFVIEEKSKEPKLMYEKAKKDGILIEYYHRLKKGEDIMHDGRLILAEEYTETTSKPKQYAYCSDSGYQELTIENVEGVDVLYHEATFVEVLKDRAIATYHSTALDAANIAKKSGAGKLLMGHLSARYETGDLHLKEAKTVFSNCQVVEDGERYVID